MSTPSGYLAISEARLSALAKSKFESVPLMPRSQRWLISYPADAGAANAVMMLVDFPRSVALCLPDAVVIGRYNSLLQYEN